MQERRQGDADLWEQVWQQYDRQRAAPAPPPAPLPSPMVERRSRRRTAGRAMRGLTACGIVAAVGFYALAPVFAAARFGEALAAGDMAWLNASVDWQQVAPALSQGMVASLEGHTGTAAIFLRGMSEDVAAGMATPQGMANLLRDRLPRGSSGSGMIGSIRPLDARHWEVALHAPGETAQAVSVTLSLADPWSMRWQVTGLRLAERPMDVGG